MGEESGRYDDVFMGLAQQHGGIQPLLNSFFGFLHRRTDFYVQFPEGTNAKMGFPAGVAENMVLNAFKSYPMKSYPGAAPASAPVATDATIDKKPQPQSQQQGGSRRSSHSYAASASVHPEPTTDSKVASSSSGAVPSQAKGSDSADANTVNVRYTEEGKQYPIGNGGVSNKYTWTQTLTDVTVYIDVDAGVTAKNVRCNISSRHLVVEVKKGQSTILSIDGTLYDAVRTDECMWTLETDDGRFNSIVITLDKVKHTWWSSIIQGDEQIDTSKVDSTQKLEDYDAQTQAAIRKIMFEQRQKMMGEAGVADDSSAESILARAKQAPGSPFLSHEQLITQPSQEK